MSKRAWWVVGVALGVVLVGVGVLVGVLAGGRGGPATAAGASRTPPPSASAPATPGESATEGASPEPDGTAACTVSYEVRDSWADGFTVDVTLRNQATALEGWELAWWFEGDERIVDLWNAVLVQPADGESGPQVLVRDAGHNAEVARRGTVTFGFVGSGQPAVQPVSFELNGRACWSGPGVSPSDTETLSDGEKPGDRPTPSASDLYLDPTTRAAAAAAAATGEQRDLLEKIASTPQAFWVTGADPTAAAAAVRAYTSAAHEDGTLGVLVIYAVPGRDCGQHSSGGVGESAYTRWVDAVAGAVVGEPWVVLEPDALPMLGDCEGQGDRVGYLAYAAKALTAAGARVYVDVGHSGWLSAEEAARRLELVGLDHAAGFALNVSNYQTTDDSVAYGERVSSLTGGARYIIDTSRNGNGSDGQWCNPRGRALGERPRLASDDGDAAHLDALLWVKLPGESDGECNGGPAAGEWFGEIALELARNADW